MMDEVPGKMGGVDYPELLKEMASSKKRNKMIIDIIKCNPSHKFMILSKLEMHVQLMCELLRKKQIENDNVSGKKSHYSDSHVVVGTFPKMSVGFDEAKACEDYRGTTSNIVILAHTVKKWQAFEQARGRSRSKYPILVWLRDKNKTCRRHFSELEEWIHRTKGTIIEIEYKKGKVVFPERKEE
jgi:hypothetical protein